MSGGVFSRRDVHCAITDKIVAAVEAGAGDYCMPWHRTVTRPVNAFTGKVYHGVNVLALWATAASRSFRSGYWATYRQWRQLDAQVRNDERGAVIVFYKTAQPKPEKGDQHAEEKIPSRSTLIARASWVFNSAQVDGWTPPQLRQRSEVEIREDVEAFIKATLADIRHGGDKAYYDLVSDYIAVPYPEQFVATETSSATEAYYSVILHELTHWTGAASRLARNLRARFGDEAYAMEELIAEFSAAFLCADLGIANEPRLRSYLAGLRPCPSVYSTES
jgi:antirestriction protein ArdC